VAAPSDVVCGGSVCFDLRSWVLHSARLHGIRQKYWKQCHQYTGIPRKARVRLQSIQHRLERAAHHLCFSFLCFIFDCLSFLCFLSLLLSLSFFFLPCFSRIASASSTLRTVPHSAPANAELALAVQGCKHLAKQKCYCWKPLQTQSVSTSLEQTSPPGRPGAAGSDAPLAIHAGCTAPRPRPIGGGGGSCCCAAAPRAPFAAAKTSV
jgi:hypothetical protein